MRISTATVLECIIVAFVTLGCYCPIVGSSAVIISAGWVERAIQSIQNSGDLAEAVTFDSPPSPPDELCRASVLAFLTCAHSETVAKFPAVNSVMGADARPEIGLALLEGRVDPAGWRLILDGNDITTQSEATNIGIVFTPTQPLFEGNHIVSVEHGTRVWEWSFRTSTPPFITRIGLESGGESSARIAGRRPVLRVEYGDEHSSIDASSLRLLLNQQDITEFVEFGPGGLEYIPSHDLEDGSYAVLFSVSDIAGNFTYAPYFFDIGEIPSIDFRHLEESYPYGSTPEIIALFSLESREISTDSLRLWFNGDDVTGLATIELDNPRRGRIKYTPIGPLASGSQFVALEVGYSNSATISEDYSFVIEDQRTYRLEILSPQPGAVFSQPRLEVRVMADLRIGDVNADPEKLSGMVSVNGEEAWPLGSDGVGLVFGEEILLVPGENAIRVRVVFDDGEDRDAEVRVFYDVPQVPLLNP
jgi:hypothetical protein